jgi:hypothetical protein
MTKRVKLLYVMKQFWELQIMANVQVWDYQAMKRAVKRLEVIEKRLPVITYLPPRISSQRKLFSG